MENNKEKDNLSVPFPLIGVICAIVVQTLGGVWWASAMNAKMEYLQTGQIKLELVINTGGNNRYTSLDATRDWGQNDRRLATIENSISENKKNITDLQIRVGKR